LISIASIIGASDWLQAKAAGVSRLHECHLECFTGLAGALLDQPFQAIIRQLGPCLSEKALDFE